MRYILVIALSLLPEIAPACQTELECFLQDRLPRVGAVPAPALAREIEKVVLETDLDPLDLARLVLVESRGRPKAYNPLSGDHGILQINTRTAIFYSIPVRCLYDWRCNLRRGALLYAKGHRACQYNLGLYRKLEGRWLEKCLAYEEKLDSV